jgi:DivIVA domain-containing protein
VRTALRGYRPADVDAFRDRCAAALGLHAADIPELRGRGGPASGTGLAPQDVADVRFPIARGYALDEVDALLDRVEAALRRLT